MRAADHVAVVFWATCGVTFKSRTSDTKSAIEIATVETTSIDQAAGLVNLTTALVHGSSE